MGAGRALGAELWRRDGDRRRRGGDRERLRARRCRDVDIFDVVGRVVADLEHQHAVVVVAEARFRPAVLRARGRAEAGVVRLQPARVHRTVGEELRVPQRQVGRAVVLDLRLTGVDDDRVERIEHVQPELGLTRAKGRGASGEDRFEKKGLDFHRSLRQGFLTIAAKDPGRCRVIDSSRPYEVVASDIWRIVAPIAGVK